VRLPLFLAAVDMVVWKPAATQEVQGCCKTVVIQIDSQQVVLVR